MPQVNPLITTPEEQFVVGESDFAFFGNYACRVEGGAILFCRSGSADATVNQYQGQVRRNTMVLLLPGSIFMLTDRTEDFRAAYCSFSRDLFSEAAFRMDPSFFHALRERPISHPPQRIVEGASIWLQMAAYTYRDRGNVFRNTIIKNRLQNLLLESYDKMQRFAARQHRVPETTTRQSELFHRFVALVHEHCAQEREVSFYADKLCISTRYLSTIVRSVAHSSAKEFIDRSVMLEIKMMLQSTDLRCRRSPTGSGFPTSPTSGVFSRSTRGNRPPSTATTKNRYPGFGLLSAPGGKFCVRDGLCPCVVRPAAAGTL